MSFWLVRFRGIYEQALGGAAGGGAVSGDGDLGREVESLREQLSRFRDAAIRVNESLDLDAVLQGVLDSARELTGARYALISPGDEDQMPKECVTSGLTAEQAEEFLQQMPNRWGVLPFPGRDRGAAAG